MHTVIWTLFMTFCLFSCYANIIPVNEMKEVFEYIHTADSKTLVIFDVDMVLVQPSDPAFQMKNIKRFGPICKRIVKELPPEKQMLFLSLMTINSSPMLIDACTLELLQTMAQRNIPAIALTANLTGSLGPIQDMAEWRVGSLRLLGIDFSHLTPYQKPLIFDDLLKFRGNYSTYLDGILFVNGPTVSKGEALLAFLKKTCFLPDKVIFIDDKEENLKSVELALQQMNRRVEYQGLHFLEAQNYPSEQLSEEAFISKWQELALQANQLN